MKDQKKTSKGGGGLHKFDCGGFSLPFALFFCYCCIFFIVFWFDYFSLLCQFLLFSMVFFCFVEEGCTVFKRMYFFSLYAMHSRPPNHLCFFRSDSHRTPCHTRHPKEKIEAIYIFEEVSAEVENNKYVTVKNRTVKKTEEEEVSAKGVFILFATKGTKIYCEGKIEGQISKIPPKKTNAPTKKRSKEKVLRIAWEERGERGVRVAKKHGFLTSASAPSLLVQRWGCFALPA